LNKKTQKDATVMASMWLDIHATTNQNDFTDEIGTTKYTEFSFCVVPMKDMIIDVRVSPIATYLHDDEKNFRNEKLTYW
jgi:hypothetical protein